MPCFLIGWARFRDAGIKRETTTSPSPPRKNRHTETSGPEMAALAEMTLETNSELAWPSTPMNTAR